MNTILEHQNKPEFIRLIKAQRVAYSDAKKYQLGFEFIALFVAMALPIIYIYWPEHKTIAGCVGALLSLVSLIIDRVQKHITKTAASIQEQFDRELFKLDWDQYNGTNKVDPEKIISYSKRYTKEDVYNWYSENITSSIPHNMAVVLCQKANLQWDKELRKEYRNLILTLSLFYACLMIASIALYFSKTYEFLGQLFLMLVGSAAFIKYCYTVIIDKTDIIKEKEELASKLNILLEKYKKSQSQPSKENLSRIQTTIFNSRRKSVKIPDWFYNLRKKKQEKEMNETTKILLDDFLGLQ
jgi:hypothetical protein